MKSDIENLLEKATEPESVELKIFQNAVIKNLKAYQESPTKKNKTNLDAARDSLNHKKEELMQKYFQSQDQGQGPAFESLLAVNAYLARAGFRISKSKIYRDKDKGQIRVNPDGSVPETEVRAYAATLERVGGNIDDLNDVHVRKANKEVERLEEQIAKLRFEREKDQGRYIPRQDFEAELAARAVVLESGFRHLFNVKASEWIALVGGNLSKSADFLQSLNTGLDDQLTTFATLSAFQVLFEQEER